jgi:hypothetical protein
MKTASILLGSAQIAEERAQDIFPPNAIATLESLMEQAQRKSQALSQNNDFMQTLLKDIGELHGQIQGAEREKNNTGIKWGEKDEKQLNRLKDKLEKLNKRRQELTRKDEEIPPEVRQREKIANELNGSDPQLGLDYVDWIVRQNSLSSFVEDRAELPPDDLEKALAKIAKRQESIIDRVLALRAASVDAETAIAEMRRQVAEKSVKGAPNIAPVTAYRQRSAFGFSLGEIQWPEEHVFTRDASQSIAGELGNCLVCWLFEDELTARLEKLIRDRIATDPDAISIEARLTEESALKTEWLENQRVQIRICHELGLELPEVHPMALFEIRGGENRAAPEPWNVQVSPPGSSPTIGIPTSRAAAGGKN